MKYVIFNVEVGFYLNKSGNKFNSDKPEDGRHFNNAVTASNYVKSTFKDIFNNIQIQTLSGMPADISDMKDPDVTFEELLATTDTFLDELTNIYGLTSLYHNRISQCDLAEQDILHKIEFDYLSPNECVDFINKIRIIRSHRRIMKNKLETLNIFTKALSNFTSFSKEYELGKNPEANKDYTPRIIKNLFEKEEE